MYPVVSNLKQLGGIRPTFQLLMLSSGVLFSALHERDQACPPAPSQITLCSRNIDPTIPLEREKGEQDCHKRRKSTPKDVAFGLR